MSYPAYLAAMEELVDWFFRFFNLPESFLGFKLKQTALDYLRQNPVKCYLAYNEAQKILLRTGRM
jgi:hypothetical protein